MGTWAIHSFGNDDAADWIDEISGIKQPVFQIDAMKAAFEAARTEALSSDLESGTAAVAVAAAEVIACELGQPRTGASPYEVTSLDLQYALKVNDDVLRLSRRALSLVTTEVSELADLWDDTDEAAEWRAHIADLDARLLKAAETHDLNPAFVPIEVTAEEELGEEVAAIYDEMHAAFERLVDQSKGDPTVEVLRQLANKIHLLHTDVTHMRHAITGSLDDLTNRIDLLEKRSK
ncbi:MAG: DUF4259 domain-containing protein [Pseudomonadota bacterium]